MLVSSGELAEQLVSSGELAEQLDADSV